MVKEAYTGLLKIILYKCVTFIKKVPQGHFLRAIIQRYITKKPKLQASKDLQKIMQRLTFTNETIFTKKLDAWYEMYRDFLAEKTLNETTGKENYKHAKLVSAYRSLRTNLPYLFTHKKYKH